MYNNELCVAITKTKHVETTEFDFVTKSKSSHKVTFKCNKILTLVKKLKLSDELCVAITKTKHVETTEFDFVTKSKSSHKVTFKCNKILTLVKKLKLSEGRFLLDLDEKQAIFKTETKEFITDIEVGQILTAKSKKALEEEEFVFDFNSSVPATANIIKERVIPIIEIPPTILKGVLNNIGVNDSLTMYLKRNFVLLVVNGITVAFGKTKVG